MKFKVKLSNSKGDEIVVYVHAARVLDAIEVAEMRNIGFHAYDAGTL